LPEEESITGHYVAGEGCWRISWRWRDERPEVHGGLAMGPDGDLNNVLVAFNGPDTCIAYIADNNGQSEDQSWALVSRFCRS
jgi:hypothetical protein